MGGKIGASSLQGRGSEFRFTTGFARPLADLSMPAHSPALAEAARQLEAAVLGGNGHWEPGLLEGLERESESLSQAVAPIRHEIDTIWKA